MHKIIQYIFLLASQIVLILFIPFSYVACNISYGSFPILLTNYILNFTQNDASFCMPFLKYPLDTKIHGLRFGEREGHISSDQKFQKFSLSKLLHFAKMSNFCFCIGHLARVKLVSEHWQHNIPH